MLALLRQPRALTGAALAALCVLAWLYVLGGAGSGMSAWQMTVTTLFPHRLTTASMSGMDMPMARWDATGIALTVAMWWLMMIAMMTPSAAPAILLYESVRRRAQQSGNSGIPITSSGVFASGYLLVWLAFSVLATVLQGLLVRADLLSAEMMTSQSRWLSAALLFAAGAYQFSPLKNACLSLCRSPAAFFTRHAGVGALRLGLLHGAYCVGCCGLLMALLFVGGVMNVVWIAALAVLVLAEKLLPGGRVTGSLAGAIFIVWSVVTLLV